MLSQLIITFRRTSPLPPAGRQSVTGLAAGIGIRLASMIAVVGLFAICTYPANAQCPAVGSASGCNAIITVTNSGASVSFTAEPPYDGIDDQIIGVVNNSNLPIHSLELTSSGALFGFDGDGIDAFGLPGNSIDTTGYGGPNAYFTNISPDQTVGTVHFIVPIAKNGGTGYFALEQALSNATACSSLINNALSGPLLAGQSLSQSGGPTEITATFTPNLGHTLSQAAAVCGFVDFDWIQKLTHLPNPSPFFENNPPNMPIHLTSSSTPFNDPPPNGYTYNSAWVSYPFYWDPNTTGFLWSLAKHKSPDDTTLDSFDAPNDPCLLDAQGNPSSAWLTRPDIKAQCGGSTAAKGSYLGFTTHLAGVNADGTGVDLGIGYTWTSTYNGTTGGIATTASYLPPDSRSGSGGVKILNVQKLTTYKSIVVTGENGNGTGAVFDVCLRDSRSGNLLQFNSVTGDYQFTQCSTGFTLSGTGTVTSSNGMQTLKDVQSDRNVSAGFNPGTLTGNANVVVISGAGLNTTYRITDTVPNQTCSCGG